MKYKNSNSLKNKFIFLFLFSFLLFSFANVSSLNLTSNLDNNLKYYFPLNETSGDAFDLSDKAFGGTLSGAIIQNASGIKGYGYNFTGENDGLDFNFSMYNEPTGIETQSIWIYLYDYNDGTILGGMRGGSYGERSTLNTTGGFNWDINGGANLPSNISLGLNKWYNLIFVKGDNGQKIFVNGVLSAYGAGTSTGNSSNFAPSSRYIGAGGQSSTSINGTLDEFTTWNERELNSTDMIELYQYYIPPIYPNYIINVPANNLNTTTKSLRFNISTSMPDNSIISNATLWINGTLNQSIVAPNINATYVFPATFNDSYYEWYVTLKANNGFTNQTITRNFTIYTNPPPKPGSLTSLFSLLFMTKDNTTPSYVKIMIILTILMGLGLIIVKNKG